MVFGDKDKLPKGQLTIIAIVVAYFFTLDAGLSASYGGIVSLLNTGLINWHINKQEEALTMNAQAIVGMLFSSVVKRMLMVAALILIGLIPLGLNASALMMGLIFGLMGFLIDRVIDK